MNPHHDFDAWETYDVIAQLAIGLIAGLAVFFILMLSWLIDVATSPSPVSVDKSVEKSI